jgi:hypothetical protein
MKKLLLLMVLSTPLLSIAQQRVYFGVSGGVSMGSLFFNNNKNVGFANGFTFGMAPLGITFAKELNNKYIIECGTSIQTMVNSGYFINKEYSPGKIVKYRDYRSTEATGFSLDIKRIEIRGKKFAIAPHIGVVYNSINQFSSKRENFRYIKTDQRTINGVTYRDTVSTSILYLNNNVLGYRLGFETWIKMADRVYLTLDLTYHNVPNTATSIQILNYSENGVIKDAVISPIYMRYLYFQVGLKWHWKDIVPVSHSD